MPRIVIAFHQRLVRSALVRCFSGDHEIEVVADVDSWEEAINQVRMAKPDILLLDANLTSMGSMEVTRRMLRANEATHVVVVAQKGEESLVGNLLDAGATAFLTKDSSVDEVRKALRTVARGERYVSHDMATRLALSTVKRVAKSPFDGLSKREMQVMLLLAQGRDTQQIAHDLCLSPKTVSTYRYRLFEKLNLDNDVKLSHLALRYGMIEI
jgi:two-component system, NarL family, invasion response regulator UvrY